MKRLEIQSFVLLFTIGVQGCLRKELSPEEGTYCTDMKIEDIFTTTASMIWRNASLSCDFFQLNVTSMNQTCNQFMRFDSIEFQRVRLTNLCENSLYVVKIGPQSRYKNRRIFTTTTLYFRTTKGEQSRSDKKSQSKENENRKAQENFQSKRNQKPRSKQNGNTEKTTTMKGEQRRTDEESQSKDNEIQKAQSKPNITEIWLTVTYLSLGGFFFIFVIIALWNQKRNKPEEARIPTEEVLRSQAARLPPLQQMEPIYSCLVELDQDGYCKPDDVLPSHQPTIKRSGKESNLKVSNLIIQFESLN